MEFIQLVWSVLGFAWRLWEFVFCIFVLWFICYSFWHGVKITSGNFSLELYGVARHIKNWK